MAHPRTLFYSPGSCSLAAHVVLEWVGEPYLLVRADAAARATPAFARVNPLGKVPALRVGDRVVTEANAILLHLTRARPDLLDGGEDAVQTWLSYLASEFHTAFSPWFHAERFHPDPAQAGAVREAARGRIRRELSHLEPRVDALPGRALDAYVYAMSRWARRVVDLPAEFPHIAAHQARLEADPAVSFALAVERDPTTPAAGGPCLGHRAVDEA